MSECWQPIPIPQGDGRHDIGDDARAAIVERLTVGWIPTCRCGGPPVRTASSQRLKRAWYRQRWQARIDARWGGLHGLRTAVVLDPFGGAGTTALVAEQLGRDSLLIELGEQNVRMTEARMGQPSAEASA